jgi:hypothetical protein
MKLKRLIFMLISILLTGEQGKSISSLQTNPYINTMVSNYILNDHTRCRKNEEPCVQEAYDLLDKNGYTSFYRKKKKCINNYMVCLNVAQHKCQAQCIKLCTRYPSGNGNANECASTCALKCQ